jgi:miniconductance mechanosensitive channel
MGELFAIKNVYSLYEGNQLLVILGIMLVTFYPFIVFVKKLLFPVVEKATDKKHPKYVKLSKKYNLARHIMWVCAALYLMLWGNLLGKSGLISPGIDSLKDMAISLLIIITTTSLLVTLINMGGDAAKNRKNQLATTIGLHMHILKIVVISCASLSAFTLVLGVSVASFFTSLGAAAALLTFVFKDTVLGLLASLQLTFQNIIQVGDWVTLPQYNADGDIQKITITVVTIRNFDGTYTTVPTTAFLNTGVKNWRHMFERGGRRIKRAISLDMDAIRICDQKMLDSLKKIPSMSDLAKEHSEWFDAKSQKTNISMFRYYVEQYLRAHQEIHQEGFTFLVRQLDPTPTGLPLELYVFTKDTNWANYEGIQADIFDHLLGIMPEFGLKAFQSGFISYTKFSN